MNVTEYYETNCARGVINRTTAQLAAVVASAAVLRRVGRYKSRRSNAFKKLLDRPDLPRGVYMWGGVGRGKSFLMDSFYTVVPVQPQDAPAFPRVHARSAPRAGRAEGQADPLDELARRIAKTIPADLLRRIPRLGYRRRDDSVSSARRLFENGVQFVMTSNYEPDTLYPDGLHRDRLLPAIELHQGEARRDQRRCRHRLPQAHAGAGEDVSHAARRRGRRGVARGLREARRRARRKPDPAHRKARDQGAA